MAWVPAVIVKGILCGLLVSAIPTGGADEAPKSRAVLRLVNGKYDGFAFSGTLLIGATEGTVLVPAWPLEWSEFSIEDVRSCATKRSISYWTSDWVGGGQRPGPVPVRPGYWYGKDVSYVLFHRPGPDCIQLTLALHLEEGEQATSLRVTLRRNQRPRGAKEDGHRGPNDSGAYRTPR